MTERLVSATISVNGTEFEVVVNPELEPRRIEVGGAEALLAVMGVAGSVNGNAGTSRGRGPSAARFASPAKTADPQLVEVALAEHADKLDDLETWLIVHIFGLGTRPMPLKSVADEQQMSIGQVRDRRNAALVKIGIEPKHPGRKQTVA